MSSFLDNTGLVYILNKIKDTFIEKDDLDTTPTSRSTKPVTSDGIYTSLSGKANASHTHGNIGNDGTLQLIDVAVGSGDKLVVTDVSGNNKIVRTSLTFDGSTTTQAISKKGTWESFEVPTNKVTSISSSSTDTEYPSAKCVYDAIQAGAQVQADWDETDTTDPSYIQNKPTVPTTYAASATAGGPANKAVSIPYAEVDSTSTSKVFTATVPGITELVDGTCVLLKNGVVTSASGFTININGLGAHPAFSNMTAATAETTIFNINYTMLFVYDSTRVVGSYTGAWCCYRGYDSNSNSVGYQVRTNSSIRTVTDAARYYKLYFTSADGSLWVPASINSSNNVTTARTPNQRPIDPFGPIVYTSANTDYTAGSNLAATTIWQQYAFNLGYSFGPLATSLTTNTPVYLKCAPQSNGSAIIDSTTPVVQALPSTDDGQIYIFLGIAYSATNVELNVVHPVYYYKDGAIRLWTNAPTQSGGGSSSAPIVFDVASADDCSDPAIIQRWQEMWDDIDANPSKNISPFKYFTFVKSVYTGSYDYNTQRLGSFDVDKTNRYLRNGSWYYYYNENTGTIESVYDD